ncbi:MAG: NUDIX domain-containing protein [Erysipelotrichaceae bacterium]
MEEIRDEKGLTLEEFLELYKTKNYPRPYLTADCIIAGKQQDQLYILLIKRKNHPSINCYGIAGGFASSTETLLECAKRELQEETTLKVDEVKLLDIYSKPNRDPRGWVVSGCYYGFVDKSKCHIKGQDDAKEAKWFRLEHNSDYIILSNDNTIIKFDYQGNYLSKEVLAFDHQMMICDFVKRLNLE